jgi:hypothetical protein
VGFHEEPFRACVGLVPHTQGRGSAFNLGGCVVRRR